MKFKRKCKTIVCLMLSVLLFAGAAFEVSAASTPSPKKKFSNYFKSEAELGKYVDKKFLAHKKTIVFYSDRSDLMQWFLPRYPTCKLEEYSVMFAGVRPKFRAKIEAMQAPYFGVYKYTVKPKYKNSKANDKKFYSKVKSVAKKARKQKGVYAKAKYINSYVTGHVRYKRNTKTISTAYTAIMKGTAMCQGYSDTFTIIARCAGLKCETVMGDATPYSSYRPAYHAWNVVKKGKKWYNIDVTFNDIGSNKTRYLMVGSKKFNRNHKLDPYYKRSGWLKSHPFKK